MIRNNGGRYAFLAAGNRHLILAVVGITLIYTWISTFQPLKYDVYVDLNDVIHETDEKFFSLALDTSFINVTMKSMTNAMWKRVTDITEKLAPAYLRLGGTAADKLIFDEFPDSYSDLVIMTKKDWSRIVEFVTKTKLKLLFNFNVLLRSGDDWDSDNAKKLLDYCKQLNFKADFQLGNEPNSFLHVFNFSLSAKQLTADFIHLRNVLNSDSFTSPALLVGPDVTRPRTSGELSDPSLKYLNEFLDGTHHILDAVSWHQYYFNGRTANLTDFVNFETMESLSTEISAVTEVVKKYSNDLPVWLTETGSAYGGGAPNLSNRFISTFLFLDKLGLAAKKGIQVVMRQSLIKGHYALINETFEPAPDFWVGYLYKKVVGTSVYNVMVTRNNTLFRIYAHATIGTIACTKKPSLKTTVVVFGINYSDIKIRLDLNFKGRSTTHCGTYVFSAPFQNLTSDSIWLNGHPMKFESRTFINFVQRYASSLDTFSMRPYTLNFWLFA